MAATPFQARSKAKRGMPVSTRPPDLTRDPTIDCARGLAMALVVLGHNLAFATISGTAVAFIFSFHVPAFFFISGYLLRPDRLAPGRLARRVLTPFLVVGLLLAAAKSFVRQESFPLALAGLAWATGPTLPSSQLWFLPSLFISLLLAGALARFWDAPLRIGVVAGTLALLLPVAYFALHAPPPPVEALRRAGVEGPIGWAWSIDLVPLAAFFSLCGYLARRTGRLDRIGFGTLALGLSLTVACFALGARTDMNLRLATPFPLAVSAALGGSVAVFALGRLCASGGQILAGALEAIGRHSIMILAFHVIVQNAVVAMVLGFADGPAGLAIAAAAGLAAGLAVPLLLSIGLDRAMVRLRPAQGAGA